MANTFKVRRSATASAVPTTAQIALGEIAVNTFDGKMFIKKNVSGTESIVEIGGSAGGSGTVTSITAGTGLTGGTITTSGTIAIDSTVATLTGTQTLTNKTLTSPVISGGSINNTTIGATTPSTGAFTTVTTPSVTAPTTDLTLSAISTGAVKFNTLGGEQVRIIDSTVTGQYTSFSRNAPQNIQLIGAIGTANLGLYSTGGGVIRFFTASDLTKEQFRVADTVSAVNFVQVTGSATGNGPTISAQGSDANINLWLQSKGGGTVALAANGRRQFDAFGSATAVNFLRASGAASGASPSLSAQGDDANVSMQLTGKGTGSVSTFVPTTLGGTIGNTAELFAAQGLNNNTVWLRASQFRHSTGTDWQSASLRLGMRIDSTDMSYIDFNPVGFSQGITIQSANAQPINFRTSGGVSFRASQAFLTGTAVNYIDASGRQTGFGPILSTNGSDANVRFNISSKGTDAVGLYTNLANQLQFNVTHTASAVNYVQVTGSATGNPPVISSQGSDTNLGMLYYSKGFGSHQFRGYNGSNIYGQFFANQVSPVNYIEFGASSSGNAVLVRTAGTDTNINLALTPKGTGSVNVTSALEVDTDLRLDALTATTTATTANQVIASFSATLYSTFKCLVQARDTTGNKYHSTEILVVSNGTTVASTEYGAVNLGGLCATYTADLSGGLVRILATPTSTNSTVFKIAVTIVKI